MKSTITRTWMGGLVVFAAGVLYRQMQVPTTMPQPWPLAPTT
jgi:hypothetical protein